MVRLDDVDVVKVLVLGVLGVLGAWVTKPMTLRVHRADDISPLRAPKSHRDDLGACGLLSIPFSSRGVCTPVQKLTVPQDLVPGPAVPRGH